MEQYPSTDIIVITTLFVPSAVTSNGRKRRQSEYVDRNMLKCFHSVTCSVKDQQCTKNPGKSGDYLFIEFLIKLRSSCRTAACQQKFAQVYEQVLASLRSNTALLVTMANGSTATIQLGFCSFGNVQPGKIIKYLNRKRIYSLF